MLTQAIEPVLRVPKVWQDLLAIEELPADTRRAFWPWAEDTEPSIDDPTPWRDDHREVAINDQRFRISLHLCSGDHNYFLVHQVDGPKDLYYESEPFFDLPDGEWIDDIVVDLEGQDEDYGAMLQLDFHGVTE
jgi:hypothetical protein